LKVADAADVWDIVAWVMAAISQCPSIVV